MRSTILLPLGFVIGINPFAIFALMVSEADLDCFILDKTDRLVLLYLAEQLLLQNFLCFSIVFWHCKHILFMDHHFNFIILDINIL